MKRYPVLKYNERMYDESSKQKKDAKDLSVKVPDDNNACAEMTFSDGRKLSRRM